MVRSVLAEVTFTPADRATPRLRRSRRVAYMRSLAAWGDGVDTLHISPADAMSSVGYKKLAPKLDPDGAIPADRRALI